MRLVTHVVPRLLSIAACFWIAGCSAGGETGPLGSSDPTHSGSPTGDSADMGSFSPHMTTPTPAPSQGSGVQAGLLTAGAWDDNRNYDFFSGYENDPLRTSLPGRMPITAAEQDAANAHFSVAPGPRTKLDVTLVVDTTGSMGDELEYLKAEIDSIAEQIRTSYPDADQRWAAVFYRDEGDDYVVRTFDFSSDIATFVSNVSAQSSGGGGDTPEEPEKGLQAAVELSWRVDPSAARLLFWIADAPHHVGHEDALASAVRAAAQGDVHIYPVAASGADALLELSMRQSAQLTGGRYLFLTDDSGIGGGHEEPTVPCYFVTHLDEALRRMIAIELSGVYAEPDASQVIRTGGDPHDGRCQLSGGREVVAY